MKVVMLVLRFPPDYGGAGIQAARLARALAARGTTVSVLTPRPPAAAGPPADPEGVRVRRFRGPAGERARDLWLGLRAALWLLLHPDWQILHLHGFSHFALLPCAVARALRRPVLVKTTLLGGDDPEVKGRGRAGRALLAAYRRCSAVVALSASLGDELRRDGHFTGRIAAIPNGVDTERFRPPTAGERVRARTAFGLPADAAVVVTSGELGRRKNAVGLVEAVAQCAHRPLCLVLAGPTGSRQGEAEELEAALGRLPDGVAVVRPGQLAADRMAELYRGADVFALASRAEGLPNSLLEAMACGLACVATDIPGSRDVLAAGGGWLVPPEHPGALASALDRLAADPGERRRLGAEARRIAEERYALPRIAERYLELYADLRPRQRAEASRA